MSRTKTPNLGGFFGNDEDYFDYSSSKSKSKSPIWSSASREEIEKMFGSKTKTPNLRGFFGNDEDYFDYSSTKSKSKSPVIIRALGGGGGGYPQLEPSRSDNSRTSIGSLKSAKSSRTFKKRYVSLDKSEEDSLGIQELLDGFEASFLDEKDRKILRTKLSEHYSLHKILLESVLKNKLGEICILPSEFIISVLSGKNLTSNRITGWDYEFLDIQIDIKKDKDERQKLKNKYNQIIFNNISHINNFEIDILNFREECSRRYLIIPVGLQLFYFEESKTKHSNNHATIFIYDIENEKGFYIDPQYSSSLVSIYTEVEDKLKYYMYCFLYEEESVLQSLNILYEEFNDIKKSIETLDTEIIAYEPTEDEEDEYEELFKRKGILKSNLLNKGKEIEKIEKEIKERASSIDIEIIKTKCPQIITQDNNCMFWSIFLTDIIIRNLDPSEDINPQAVIEEFIRLYGDRPKKLETIILRYVKYLQSMEI